MYFFFVISSKNHITMDNNQNVVCVCFLSLVSIFSYVMLTTLQSKKMFMNEKKSNNYSKSNVSDLHISFVLYFDECFEFVYFLRLCALLSAKCVLVKTKGNFWIFLGSKLKQIKISLYSSDEIYELLSSTTRNNKIYLSCLYVIVYGVLIHK